MSTMFGRSLFGHLIYAGPDQGGAGSIDTSVPDFYPGQFTVIAYNKSGTKTAYFGSGAEHNALSKVDVRNRGNRLRQRGIDLP